MMKVIERTGWGGIHLQATDKWQSPQPKSSYMEKTFSPIKTRNETVVPRFYSFAIQWLNTSCSHKAREVKWYKSENKPKKSVCR